SFHFFNRKVAKYKDKNSSHSAAQYFYFEFYFLSARLKNQFRINAAKVAVPIPPRLKLPNVRAKSPVPKIMVTAATIRFLFCEKSTLFAIQMLEPAMVIKPKTTIEAPVRIAVGMV